MTGGAGGHSGVTANRFCHGMVALSPVTALAVHPGAVACFVASETASGIVGGLNDTRSLVEILSGLERVAGSEAKLAGCRIPTEAVLYPAATILKDRRAGVVASTKEPGECNCALGTTLTNGDALSVISVGSAAALPESFAREAFAIVGLECESVPRLGLQVHLVLMARGASEG